MLAEQHDGGRLALLHLGVHLRLLRQEGGALGGAQADHQADGGQGDRQQERQAPAPRREGVAGDPGRQRNGRGAEQQTGGHPDLRPRAEETAPAPGGVLDRDDRGPAPLPADGETLRQAQHAQQQRRGHPDLGVGRHQADRGGGDGHHREGEDERRLAPDAVTEVAGDDRPQRPGEEPDAEGGQGDDLPHAAGEVGEEQLAEHQRGGRPVDRVLVPLDDRADGPGLQGPAAQLPGGGWGLLHRGSPSIGGGRVPPQAGAPWKWSLQVSGAPAYLAARTSPDRAWPSNSSTRAARPHRVPSRAEASWSRTSW